MGRRLGQHFLHRTSILRRIAEAACPAGGETVVEIGPGKGALTAALLERASRVIAIEIDTVLVHYLEHKFRDEPKLEIVNADILQTDYSGYRPSTVTGNLPYYITSPIVTKVLAGGAGIGRAVFLVQKEVAERIVSPPGSRDYGFLSVQCQLLAEAELLFTVPPDAFRPPPKVDSAVLLMRPRPVLPAVDSGRFLHFAGLAFAHKRKTLRNNLAVEYGKEILDRQPESKLRAEQLSVEQLLSLYGRLNP